MTVEARLKRLYPALTAKERGLLVLHAYKAGEPPDRTIYDTCPYGQGPEFNRYINLMNAVNFELTYALLMICEQVRHIDLKYGWLMSLLLCGREIDMLDGILARTKDRKLRADLRRVMKRSPVALEVPVDLTLPTEVHALKDGFGPNMVRALLIGIKTGLDEQWAGLRSIEIVVEEQREEFGGEDPLRADGRVMLDEAKTTCRTIHEAIQVYVERFPLPEPPEDAIGQVRAFLEKVAEGERRW